MPVVRLVFGYCRAICWEVGQQAQPTKFLTKTTVMEPALDQSSCIGTGAIIQGIFDGRKLLHV